MSGNHRAPDGRERYNMDGLPLYVHARARCIPPCPIHAPSDHHMKDWPRYWRSDRQIVERTCRHGVGHPDPDDMKMWLDADEGVHGCDGCCVPPEGGVGFNNTQ